MYQIGDVLSIPCTVYRHYMIVVGHDLVVHASKEHKSVVAEEIVKACAGKPIKNHGKESRLSNSEIIRRAEQEIGRPYRLFNHNCEHLVRKISGEREASPQVVVGTLAVAFIGLFLLTRSRAA